jgi:hypothetical protein
MDRGHLSALWKGKGYDPRRAAVLSLSIRFACIEVLPRSDKSLLTGHRQVTARTVKVSVGESSPNFGKPISDE